MSNDEPLRRDILFALATLPLVGLAAQPTEAKAQAEGSPVKVDMRTSLLRMGMECRADAAAPSGGTNATLR